MPATQVRALVLRGLVAGAVAGVLAFVLARVFGEPLIQSAIDYEGARDAAQQALNAAAGRPVEPAGDELVSRGIQGNLGLGVGVVFFGVAMGALFAVAFSLAWGRVAERRPRVLAALLALAGFVTVYLVPFLKYPANPPAIGHEDTIGPRTGLYLTMVLGSVAAAAAATWLRRRLVGALGGWNAGLLGAVAFAVLVGALMLALPSTGALATNVDQYGPAATETPRALRDAAGAIVFPGFDADLLYAFRCYSVLAAALLWATIGLCYGPLAERVLSSAAPRPDALTRRD